MEDLGESWDHLNMLEEEHSEIVIGLIEDIMKKWARSLIGKLLYNRRLGKEIDNQES